MEQPIQLDKINDTNKLKSLAFDQMQILNQAQQNLQNIQQRLNQLNEQVERKGK